MMWKNCPSLKKFKLKESEWEIIERVLDILIAFKEASKALGNEKFPSLARAVTTINILIDKIEEIVFELDGNENRTHLDENMIIALQAGKDKILEYYNKSNWISCIDLILDPRHKVVAFDLTEWGRSLKKEAVERFRAFFGWNIFRQLKKISPQS